MLAISVIDHDSDIHEEPGIKLPFISENYRLGFLLKINGNFGTDKVSVYRYKVTVFLSKSYRCDESFRLSR